MRWGKIPLPHCEHVDRLLAVSLKFADLRMSRRIGVCFFFGLAMLPSILLLFESKLFECVPALLIFLLGRAIAFRGVQILSTRRAHSAAILAADGADRQIN